MNAATSYQRYNIDDIRDRLDGRQIAEQYLGAGRRVASGFQYSNPSAHQATGSFTVYQNGYHDFKTGEHGDTFALLALLEGLDVRADYPRVLEVAAGIAGISATEGPRPIRLPKPAPVRAIELPPDAWQSAMREAARVGEANLWTSVGLPALDYMRKRIDAGRGYPVEQIDALIKSMGMGYLPAYRNTGLKKEGGETLRIDPGVLFPYIDEQGAVTALQVRLGRASLEVHDKKYKYVAGSKPTARPYIVGGQWLEGAPIVITESVIKAAAVKLEYPGYNCVGMGSAGYGLAPDMVETIRRCTVIHLAMDNDLNPDTGCNPGQDGQARLAAAIGGSTVRLCVIPFGKDPDGYIAEGGKLADLFDTATVYTPAPTPIPNSDAAIARQWPYGLPDIWSAALSWAFKPNVGAIVWVLVEAARAGLIDESFTLEGLVAAARTMGHIEADAKTPIMYRNGFAAAVELGVFQIVAPSSIYINSIDSVGIDVGATFSLAAMADLIALVGPHIRWALAMLNADPKYKRFTRLDAAWFEDIGAPVTLAAEVQAALTDAITLPADARLIDTDAIYTRFMQSLPKARRSTPLDAAWRFTSAAQFREARLRGLAQQDAVRGETHSNLSTAGYFLGVTVQAVKKIRIRAGLAREEVKPHVDLDPSKDIAAQVNAAAKAHKAKPLYVESTCDDGSIKRTAWGAGLAQSLEGMGGTVTIVLQAASRDLITVTEQPAAIPRQPRTDRIETPRSAIKTEQSAERPVIPIDVTPVIAPVIAPVVDKARARREAWVRAQLIGQMIIRGEVARHGVIQRPDGEIVAYAGSFEELTTTDLIDLARGRNLAPLDAQQLAALAAFEAKHADPASQTRRVALLHGDAWLDLPNALRDLAVDTGARVSVCKVPAAIIGDAENFSATE